MKLLRVFLILVVLTALVFTIAAVPIKEQDDIDFKSKSHFNDEAPESDFEHKFGRFLCQKKRKTQRITCNKFPRICRAKGSPGPHCCKKKCVNVLIDRLNCGACGKKCKYNTICCNGKCVDSFSNRRHCGSCNNRCKNGEFCAFGLCNYA